MWLTRARGQGLWVAEGHQHGTYRHTKRVERRDNIIISVRLLLLTQYMARGGPAGPEVQGG